MFRPPAGMRLAAGEEFEGVDVAPILAKPEMVEAEEHPLLRKQTIRCGARDLRQPRTDPA